MKRLFAILTAVLFVQASFAWDGPGFHTTSDMYARRRIVEIRDSLGALTLGSSTPYRLKAVDGSPDSAVFVDASGNVGIGTTAPGAKLEAKGPDDATGVALKITNSSGAARFSIDGYGQNTTNPYLTWSGDGVRMTSSAGKLRLVGGASIGSTYEATSPPTDGMIIEGNVGIGTTTPDKLLGLGDGTDEFSLSVASDKLTIWDDAATPNARVVVDSAGNVGIGTTAPSGRLHVVGGVGYFADNSLYPTYRTEIGGTWIDFEGVTGGDLGSIQYAGSNRLQFNGTNQWFNTGNVGIGETSPATRLEVEGGISIGDTTGFVLADAGTATITTESNVILDTFGAVALDTVATLTGAIGQIIYISTRDAGRDVEFLDAGNFALGAGRLLDDPADVLVLKATSATTWKEISFANNN